MSHTVRVPPFDYVIFGGTGDLTTRKLLPALYHRFRQSQLNDNFRIIGVARSLLSHDEFRERALNSIKRHVESRYHDDSVIHSFIQCIFYCSVNSSHQSDEGKALKTLLEKYKCSRIRVFYLATSPLLYKDICCNLARWNLICDQSRVVLEKPIGTDLSSARAINHDVGEVFREDQIFRIDHYLGKETVQNILALRFANPLFERIWSADAIDHVQISTTETVGLEGRAAYYDNVGALRDMIQNHLLQVLCLIAMDAPGAFNANALRNEKLKVLHALEPITATNAGVMTVRGQYGKGQINGNSVKSYLEDLGTSSSMTETFVAVKIWVNLLRWGRVPFYLRTGKRLATRMSEVVIQLKPVNWSIFSSRPKPNKIVIRIQPDEGVNISVMVKDSLPTSPDLAALRSADINISFQQAFNTRYPDSYEQLLSDTIRGDPTLFIRRDEVEVSWSWIDPILMSWKKNLTPISTYTAGSWGPTESQALLAQSGHVWHEDML